MKSPALAFALFLSTLRLSAAETNNFILQPEQMKEDVRFLMQTMEQVHPKLYYKTSRGEISRQLAALNARLTNPLARLDFYYTLAPFAYAFQDDHTVLYTPIGAKPAPRPDGVNIEIPDYKWKFRIVDGNIGYLDFVRMSNLDEFRAFLAATFAAIKDKQLDGLIIDLRKNDGGDSSLGDALLDYVNDKPYSPISRKELRFSRQFISTIPRFFKDIWVAEPDDQIKQFCFSNPPPMVKNLFAQNPCPELKTYLAQNAPVWMKNYLQQYAPHWLDPAHSPGTQTEILFQEYNDLRQPPNPYPLRFHGPVCFLIGPVTFSSAVILGNSVQDFHLATLIGEESHPCNQFGEPYNYTLPNSHLYGCVAAAQYVRANGDAKDPHGIIPDLEVKQTKADTEKGLDTVLEAAKRWVREHPRAPAASA
jgi:hypothetical protein